MKLCVSHVYWMLLFTSVVSSALLFLIVASENIQNNKFIGPDRHDVLEREKNNSFIKDFNNQLQKNAQENSHIHISSSLKSKVEQNFENNQESISASFDSSHKNEEKFPEEIEISKDSLIQQSNFSHGTSEGEQTVVLTLVKTASSLHSLTGGRGEFLSNPILDEGNISIGLTRDNENLEENVVNISQLLEGQENVTNNTHEYYENDDDDNVVVVVRAEQKNPSSIRVELEIEGKDEKNRNRVEEPQQEEVEKNLSSEQMQKNPATTAPELNDSAARARLTGSVDDSAAVILDSFVTAGPSDTHEEIPSFNEWAQKRLEEVEKKKVHPNASVQTANGSPGRGLGSMRMRSKNYASPDCGAKIVAANPESRSARSILVSTRDEYMLNTCTTRVWFVVELCEAIQAKKIELANFELFSSSPKDLMVYVSDRFPTRDWSNVGQFTARDERDVQSFSLQPHLFGKFIKVELHSHYGSEHFCPISLFRAYGTSEFEVLETETETGSIETDQGHESSIGGKVDVGFDAENEDEDDEESVFKDEDDSRGDRSGGHIFDSARDAVISIVKKAAEVLVKNDDLKSSNNMTSAQKNENSDVFNDATINDCVTPIYNVICHDCDEDRFSQIFQLVSCKRYQLQSLLNTVFIKRVLNTSRVCDNTSEFDPTYANVLHVDNSKVHMEKKKKFLKHEIQAQFLTSFFSPNYLTALCNILAAKENKLFINATRQEHLSVRIPNETYIEQNSQTLVTKDERFVSTRPIDVISTLDNDKTKVEIPVIKSNIEIATESQKIENLATWIKPTKTTVMNDEVKKKSFLPNIESSRSQQSQDYDVYQVDNSLTIESPIPAVTKRTSIHSQKTSGSVLQEHVQCSQEGNSQDIPVLGTISKLSQNLDITQKFSQNSGNVVNGEVEVESEEEVETKIKTDSIEQDSKTNVQDQLNFEGFDFKDIDVENLQNNGGVKNDASVTQQTASATTPQQKESVFLRLSNRIKALERNMSLSSQYLEELSRRYKKQVEEMQRSLERAVTTMGEETRRGEEREIKRIEEVTTLRNQIANLARILDLLVQERNSWRVSFLSLIQHTLFVLINVVLVIIILSYCRRADDGLNYLEESNDQNNSMKRTRGTNYEIAKQQCTQMTKKSKKRRPSEIASQVSGTYDQLMIEDSLSMNHLSKRDRRKKRKKDSIILRTLSIKETNSIGKGGGDSEGIMTRISTLPSRSCSTNDALNMLNEMDDYSYSIKVSQKQGRPASAPDNSIDYFHNALQHQIQHERKVQILSKEVNHDQSVDNNENNVLDIDVLNASTILKDDVFEQVENIAARNINVKPKKLSSPSFIKTALASRSKRISFSGSVKKKQSQNLDDNLNKSNGKWDSAKRDLLPELENSNGFGDERSNGRTTNGHVEESDESRSSSATPTMNWNKKEKKSNGLKKMVRKFF